MTDTGPTGVPGGVVGFIRDLAASDVTATAALKQFRDAGGSIRTQTWYRAFGEVQASIANRQRIADLDPLLLPSDEVFTPWTARVGGRYAYQVLVFTRDRDTGIVTESEYTHLTNDVIAPAVAEQAATETFTAATGRTGTFEGQQVLGAATVGLYRSQPPE